MQHANNASGMYYERSVPKSTASNSTMKNTNRSNPNEWRLRSSGNGFLPLLDWIECSVTGIVWNESSIAC